MSERTELQAIIAEALGDSNNGNLSKFVADQVLEYLSGKASEEARLAWDAGFTACGKEYQHQTIDPTYAIHRDNPHAPSTGTTSNEEFWWRVGFVEQVLERKFPKPHTPAVYDAKNHVIRMTDGVD